MGPVGDVIVMSNEYQELGLRDHALAPRVLKCQRNLGFGGAVNYALRTSLNQGYSHFFVLNDDLKPIQDLFGPMKELLLDPEVGFVSPITFDPQGAVESCGVDIDPSSPYVVHHRTTFGDAARIEVESVHGAALAFTAETLERVGYLDEEFFYSWEETDWCRRAKSMGLQNCVATRARAYHLGNASIRQCGGGYEPAVEYMLMRNMLFFLDKRGFGTDCIVKHIDYWLNNSHKTCFQTHEPPPDSALARAVIERAVNDYQNGRTGIWPDEISADLPPVRLACNIVSSS